MGEVNEVRYAVDGDVATLILARPGKHNSVTDPMWEQLTEHLRDAVEDDAVRMVVIRGHGSSFSSGADLDDLVAAAGDPGRAQDFCRRIAEALHALATSPKLTVAALSHHVRGGGAEIALACDLRIAQQDVFFQIPVSRLGVVPDRFTLRRLVRLAGPGVARRVLLLTHELDATECFRVGLVDQLVPVGGLDDALADVAGTLRRNVAPAVRASKQMLLEEEDLGTDPERMIEEFVASVASDGVADRGRRVLDRP